MATILNARGECPIPIMAEEKNSLLPWHTLGLWEASRVTILIIDLHEKPIEGQHIVLETFPRSAEWPRDLSSSICDIHREGTGNLS